MRLPDAVDVAIVGGGPAGAATAIALRRRGIDAVILDRAAFPRDKVCGDVLLPEAQDGLRALGLDLADLEARAYPCTGVRYSAARGAEVAGLFRDRAGAPSPWWMIRRRHLDAWLLDQARRAGARVYERAAVEDVLTQAGSVVNGVMVRGRDGARHRILARVVVGADGASSVIARSVGAFTRQPDHTCIAGRAYVSGVSLPQPFLEVFTTDRILPGCAWIVPVSATEVNVGIGLVQATARQLDSTPQTVFEGFRRESTLLGQRLKEAGPIALQGWMLPAATEQRPLAGPGWVLVGDAGAMVDPFTGHGIQNAIAAAGLAAGAIGEALQSRDPRGSLAAYETRWRHTFTADIERGRLLQRLHAKPRLTRALIAACARHTGLRDTFLALVGHTAPRQALLAPASLMRSAMRFRAA